jgi:transcriptional regulator with XRE-family HTH domain
MPVGGHRARLAEIVRRERTRRGLSIRSAAAQAGVDRGTWTGVEDGTRLPQAHKAAQMEPVIGLGPGSFESVLAGGDPLPLEREQPPPLTEEQRELMDVYKFWEDKHGRNEALKRLNDAVDWINEQRAFRRRRTG